MSRSFGTYVGSCTLHISGVKPLNTPSSGKRTCFKPTKLITLKKKNKRFLNNVNFKKGVADLDVIKVKTKSKRIRKQLILN